MGFGIAIGFGVLVVILWLIPNIVQVFLQQKNTRTRLPKYLKDLLRQQAPVEKVLPEIKNYKPRSNQSTQEKQPYRTKTAAFGEEDHMEGGQVETTRDSTKQDYTQNMFTFVSNNT